jgi:hypothetical protein
LELVEVFLTVYTDPLPNIPGSSVHGRNWNAVSLQTASILGKGPWFARQLRVCTTVYIKTRSLLVNNYGSWNKSRLEDEDMANELHLHLQSVRKYIHALDLMHYLAQPKVQSEYGMKKIILLATA